MRLVATDLDGTIVRRDGSVSARTVAALRACEQAGITVVMVTGRPPRWLPEVIEATGIGGLAVCANGAVVYDIAGERIHRAHTIEPAVALHVVQALRERLPDASVALETTTGALREHGFVPTMHTREECPRGDLAELLDDADGVIKVLVRASGGSDRLLELAREVVGTEVEATHSNDSASLLELGPTGVSKAVTLAELVADLGVAQQDVIAFGDQPNDVPMLRWAGTGFAMADGHPAALAAADEVAPACEQDGVAQVLERLLTDRG